MTGSLWLQVFGEDVRQENQRLNIFATNVLRILGTSSALPQIYCNGIGDMCRHIFSHVIHSVSEFSNFMLSRREARGAAGQSVRDWDQL